jgi:glycosyltransferase involved in cell wall biosynthesis
MPSGQQVAVVGAAPWSVVHFRGPLLQAMVERGHRVVACAAAADAAQVKALHAMGVSYRQIPFDRTGLSPLSDLATARSLVTLFREIRPDVVFSYAVKPVIYASLAARLAGVPRIFSMIEGLGYAFGSGAGVRRSLLERAVRVLYRAAMPINRCVFFLNPDDRLVFDRLGLLGARNRSVVLNGIGVDLDHFAPAPLPEEGVSFLLMGRLLRPKGVGEYVAAARLIKARYPEVKFRLAGGFDSHHPDAIPPSELESWVSDGTIEFLGVLKDVRPAVAAASVFVLPSYYPEGQPRTILEAMAMGRPIITTDSPGCRETVEPGRNGYLVPVRDVPALVEGMEAFIREPPLAAAMGGQSRRLAEAKYNVHDVNRVILTAMDLG